MGSSMENSHMHITHPWVDFMSTRGTSGTCKTAAVPKVYNLPSKHLPSLAESVWWRWRLLLSPCWLLSCAWSKLIRLCAMCAKSRSPTRTVWPFPCVQRKTNIVWLSVTTSEQSPTSLSMSSLRCAPQRVQQQVSNKTKPFKGFLAVRSHYAMWMESAASEAATEWCPWVSWPVSLTSLYVDCDGLGKAPQDGLVVWNKSV